jgi:hypothetical protein
MNGAVAEEFCQRSPGSGLYLIKRYKIESIGLILSTF